MKVFTIVLLMLVFILEGPAQQTKNFAFWNVVSAEKSFVTNKNKCLGVYSNSEVYDQGLKVIIMVNKDLSVGFGFWNLNGMYAGSRYLEAGSHTEITITDEAGTKHIFTGRGSILVNVNDSDKARLVKLFNKGGVLAVRVNPVGDAYKFTFTLNNPKGLYDALAACWEIDNRKK